MLRKIRITLAAICFVFITLLFLDFTGTIHSWFGWLAKIQLLPAVMALNVGVIVGLILLTLICGRVYCSVICPMGVFQDIVSWIASKRQKNRFSYSPAKSVLRYTVLGIFIASMIVGIHAIVALLAPYSAYGRIASSLFAPIYQWINNFLAYLAERADSYAFYSVDVWIKNWITLGIAAATFLIITILAWRNGRTYCNTVCPVGTVLGFFARFSYLKPHIDESKCVKCNLCARRCKAACIDSKNHSIDYSRCVSCMDCMENCHVNAISYAHPKAAKKAETDSSAQPQSDDSRRKFLSLASLFAISAAVKAQKMKVDGGLAVLEDREIPKRKTPVVPSGAVSFDKFTERCTACQLCVSVCPNHVLKPSGDISRLMQPEMYYEDGYCRPECTRCAEVCPSDAILPIKKEDKSSIQIGHAVWVKRNCIVTTDGVPCGNCARNCPNGAIRMVPVRPDDPESAKFPVVETERCIGCGACEYVCPARPFSAIFVEGHENHRTV